MELKLKVEPGVVNTIVLAGVTFALTMASLKYFR